MTIPVELGLGLTLCWTCGGCNNPGLLIEGFGDITWDGCNDWLMYGELCICRPGEGTPGGGNTWFGYGLILCYKKNKKIQNIVLVSCQ